VNCVSRQTNNLLNGLNVHLFIYFFMNIEVWLSVRKDRQVDRLDEGTIDNTNSILPFRNYLIKRK
jgi:hypothetical protein